MTVTELWAHPKGNRRDRAALSELPDGGDLLHLFRSFAAEISPYQLQNESNESYAAVVDIEPIGRSLTLAVEVGRYGEKGRLIDTKTMAEKGRFDTDDAIQVITHGVLLVPRGANSALLFLERANNQCGVIRLLQIFTDRFHLAYPDLRLEAEAVVEGEAWLEHASLIRVSAFRRRREQDKADNYEVAHRPAFAGDIAHTLLPGPGAKSLPRWIYDGLTGGSLAVGDLLNFAEDEDESEAEVTLEGNGRRKTFIIGKERRPSVSYPLSGHNEDAWTSAEVRNFVFRHEHAADLFDRIGIDWTDGNTVGAWTAADLEAKMVTRGDQQG
jgi:hypothetical protein